MGRPSRSYARVAWCYDELAALWSCGAIPRAKAAAAQALEPGARCLFAGVGRGADAVLAAQRGVEVIALDAEPAMLQRLELALAERKLRAQCIAQDWFCHAPAAPYDAVVASFVLNVFSGDDLERALDRLVGWLKPGGLLWVVDFAPPRGGAVRRAAAQLRYWPVAVVARGLGLCALHPIHDYGPRLVARGLDLKDELDFGGYRVWLARRPHTISSA